MIYIFFEKNIEKIEKLQFFKTTKKKHKKKVAIFVKKDPFFVAKLWPPQNVFSVFFDFCHLSI